jgi:hypothetical protein
VVNMSAVERGHEHGAIKDRALVPPDVLRLDGVAADVLERIGVGIRRISLAGLEQQTEQDGTSLRRLAMTQSAEPPPTTMMRKGVREVFWCGLKFMVMTFKVRAERSPLSTRAIRVGEIAP